MEEAEQQNLQRQAAVRAQIAAMPQGRQAKRTEGPKVERDHRKEIQTMFIRKLKDSLNQKTAEHNRVYKVNTSIKSYG